MNIIANIIWENRGKRRITERHEIEKSLAPVGEGGGARCTPRSAQAVVIQT